MLVLTITMDYQSNVLTEQCPVPAACIVMRSLLAVANLLDVERAEGIHKLRLPNQSVHHCCLLILHLKVSRIMPQIRSLLAY